MAFLRTTLISVTAALPIVFATPMSAFAVLASSPAPAGSAFAFDAPALLACAAAGAIQYYVRRRFKRLTTKRILEAQLSNVRLTLGRYETRSFALLNIAVNYLHTLRNDAASDALVLQRHLSELTTTCDRISSLLQGHSAHSIAVAEGLLAGLTRDNAGVNPGLGLEWEAQLEHSLQRFGRKIRSVVEPTVSAAVVHSARGRSHLSVLVSAGIHGQTA